jgi:hypothetical protein
MIGCPSHQLLLKTYRRRLFGRSQARPLSICVEDPRERVVGKGQLEYFLEADLERSRPHAHDYLDTTIKIAMHQIGTADVRLLSTSVFEEEDPRVFEEAAQDASNSNAFAQAFDSGAEAADPSYNEVDLEFLRDAS